MTPDARRKDYMKISIIGNIIGLIILAGIIVAFSFYTLLSMKDISDDIQIKMSNTNKLLTKLNDNIENLDQLNNHIKEIKNKLSLIESSISILPNNTATLISLKTDIFEINDELELLTQIYPPEQTVVLDDINQEELTNIVNNAVNVEFENIRWKINFNLILNIIFGSLFTIGFVCYLIFKKEKEK